ncbi:LOW QUALITY PROTEIN: WD40-repeat-containing domain protein [Colletotrichum cereale]|nr:LOW QUALITY PROTEIN: WD40-repeat-containing domain protein [Colletotrichum cereale]
MSTAKPALSDKDTKLLADLQSTDPSDDKTRIERTKGGLLQDLYRWILDHGDFHRWRDGDQSQLLWIKGDPGKGKTMLLCGIIDELKKDPAKQLSYFFCQATDVRLNNATAVLRGLIYQLLDQEPSLIGRVRKKYDHAGKKLFEDVNSWDALSKMLSSILEETSMQSTYLVIDALDECDTDLNQLLHLVVQVSSSSRAKLVVSSRNWPDIEDALADATQKIRLCLELNRESISAAVDKYIQYKVDQLARSKKYDCNTRDAVQQHLASNANDTFLWVALVCQELADPKVRKWHTRAKLHTFPPGLDSLYARMVGRVFSSGDADVCRQVFGLVSVAYRPLSLTELACLAESLEEYADDADSLEEIIGTCGSLLTLREGVVYFVHQSAKEFLLKNESERIYPHGVTQENRTIASRSIQVMSRTLRRDVYNLRAPGFPIGQVKPPEPDPLAPARYSCVYWVNHLADGNPAGQEQRSQDPQDRSLQNGGPVYTFLRHHYLHWLEALSLLRVVSEGILQVLTETSELTHLAQDRLRFIRMHRASIECSPLQTYASALIFSPIQSITRKTFCWEEPTWIPAMENKWNACLQTLEGHSGGVTSVAFLRDGMQLASASKDCTVKVWDAATGQCLRTLEGHGDYVRSVAFSGDGTQLASASKDCTVKVWDSATGQCLRTLKGHSDIVYSVAFSSNSTQLASASRDRTVKVWDSATGQCLQTHKGHNSFVISVAFSGNGTQLASGSVDNTIKVWDSAIGHCLETLEGHYSHITSVAFSSNGTQLASASWDNTIKVWDSQCLRTLEDHCDLVSFVAFLSDSTQLASGSFDNTVKVWDSATGQCLQTFKGHSKAISSVAFSGNSKQLASASFDNTVKTLEVHCRTNSVAFSGDGMQLASASKDCTVKVWDAATGQCLRTLEDHSHNVTSVAFSGDGTQLASGSFDNTVKVWDSATGQCLRTFHIGRWLEHNISFSKTHPHLLETAIGTIDLERPPTISTTASLPLTSAMETPRFEGYAVSADGVWITRNSRNVLWLPPEYRPAESAVVGSTIAIACASGRVLFFQFSKD